MSAFNFVGNYFVAWSEFVTRNAWDWFYSTIRWLGFPGPLYIIHYKNLKLNLRNEVHKILNFLNMTISDEELDCVVENSEGNYHRKSAAVMKNPYRKLNRETINLLDTFAAAVESTASVRAEYQKF